MRSGIRNARAFVLGAAPCEVLPRVQPLNCSLSLQLNRLAAIPVTLILNKGGHMAATNTPSPAKANPDDTLEEILRLLIDMTFKVLAILRGKK